MNESLTLFWIIFFLIVVGPMIMALNYRLIKKSNVDSKERVRKLLNPFAGLNIDRGRLDRRDKLFAWATIFIAILWLVFPFFKI